MKKILIPIALLLIGCKDSQYYRDKHGLTKEVIVDYKINSIRVDDDGEYHIVAVSPSGNVKTLYDENQQLDIDIEYSNVSNPILQILFSNRDDGDKLYEDTRMKPKAILPYGFKIETFND